MEKFWPTCSITNTITNNAHSFHGHSLKMIYEGYLRPNMNMHIVSNCALQCQTYHNLSESLKILFKEHVPFSKRDAVSSPEITWFSCLTVVGYRHPYVFNTPSVPLAVRKTLRIVFVTHVSSFQKVLLCHTGSKQNWYLIPSLSDTKRASSRSLRKRVQLHPLLWKAASKSSYALVSLRAQVCMQQT